MNDYIFEDTFNDIEDTFNDVRTCPFCKHDKFTFNPSDYPYDLKVTTYKKYTLFEKITYKEYRCSACGFVLGQSKV